MSDAPNPAADTPAATTTAAVANTDPATATAPGTGEGHGDAGKTVDEPKAGDTPADDKPAEVTGAPETYEAFTVAEGYALEGARAERATTLFKELNLPQEAAQRLIDAFVESDGENRSMLDQMREQETADRIEAWGRQSKESFGAEYDAKVALALKAVKAVDSPELQTAFSEQGWGNHPELIRAFAFYGAAFGETGMNGLGGGTSGGQPAAMENRMYPSMAPK